MSRAEVPEGVDPTAVAQHEYLGRVAEQRLRGPMHRRLEVVRRVDDGDIAHHLNVRGGKLQRAECAARRYEAGCVGQDLRTISPALAGPVLLARGHRLGQEKPELSGI